MERFYERIMPKKEEIYRLKSCLSTSFIGWLSCCATAWLAPKIVTAAAIANPHGSGRSEAVAHCAQAQIAW